MSRGIWNIETKSGGSWVSDGTIYRPNESMSVKTTSTQKMIQLANGNYAFVTPSTLYNVEPLNFIWFFDDGTTKTKIEGYIQNHSDLKITDHNSDIYYGRFTDLDITWLRGYSDNKYDVSAIFTRIPSLA